jgi:NAD(P)-dependent dehydrogenase (short-subunit alcohol dehydrogenase family)
MEEGMRLKDKVVVITGAGAGMGRAMAHRFAEEGAKLVVGEIDPTRLETVVAEVEAAGGTIAGLVGNVAAKDDAEKLIQTAIDTYGKLDVLVNNAGVMDNFEGIGNFSDAQYQRVFGVNVYGPMVLSSAAVRFMKEHGGGSIVNVASAAGVGGASAGAIYTASKHAVIGLTRNTAFTYASNGIRCNAIVAGAVNTSIGTSMDPTKMDQEALARYSTYHALAPGQLQPEDIANLALFLASDESKMINGALVAADAGWSAA